MSSDSEVDEATVHSASLKRLQTKDPDFYEFLKENDEKLLDFEVSDEEDNAEGEDSDEDDSPSRATITPQKLAYIRDHIRVSPTIPLCKELVLAFKTAVKQADGDEKIDMSNSELFNSVIKTCLVDLQGALLALLHFSPDADKKKLDPTRSRSWKRLKSTVQSYLTDLLKLFSVMGEQSIQVALLKHMVHMAPFFRAFVKLNRQLVKRMVGLWCSDQETARVLSLLVIVRSTGAFSREHQAQVLKTMYFSYIKNCKFTSPKTWPMISFMKRSLAELYALHPETAYEHAFAYVRQLAIHLRNALTTKKKESFQTVYNWQFVHCLLFWIHLLTSMQEYEPLKGLLYPVVQTTLGTVNLIPTARYVPLRLHLVRGLMEVSERTNTFIPVLPLIMDVLTLMDYNRRAGFSVKPVDFSCVLKVSKSQLVEAGFRDACVSEVCGLVGRYLGSNAHSIGFPELSLSAVIWMRKFVKECKVSKFTQQLKALMARVEENAAFISERRKSVGFGVSDKEAVDRWEAEVKELRPPLLRARKEQQPAKGDPPKEEEKPLTKAKGKSGREPPRKRIKKHAGSK